MANKKFATIQPKDGDTVLHCGHLENKPHHFFGMTEPDKAGRPDEVIFTRPDKTTGRARWMVLCSGCIQTHAMNPAAAMRADAKWIGDEPAIQENLQ